LLPIGLSIIAMTQSDNERTACAASGTALLLANCYSASIGGIATFDCTPPTPCWRYLLDTQGIEVGFWHNGMLLGLPVCLW